MRKNSLLIKVQVATYQKLSNSNGNTFSSIPHMLFLISPLNCCFRRLEFNNTLLYQKVRGRKYKNRNINILAPFYWNSIIPSLPSVKKHKKPEVDKKIQTCETCSKQLVPRLLTLNWSEHFIQLVAFKFVVETIIHHYYCILVTSFIWETRVWVHRMFRSMLEYF